MWVSWLFGVALAVPPTELVQLRPVSEGQVEQMKVSPFGDVLVGRAAGSTSGWVYDLDSWELVTFNPCGSDGGVTGVAPIDLVDEDGRETTEIWITCADGTVRAVVWDGDDLATLGVSDSTELVLDVADSLSDIWFDPFSEWLYALSPEGFGDNAQSSLHVIDPLDSELDAVDADVAISYPKALAFQGYNEGVLVSPNPQADGVLVVSHGGRGMSSLTLGDNDTLVVTDNTGFNDCDDLAATPFGRVYCLDMGLGLVIDFPVPLTGPGLTLPLGNLNNPDAVGVSDDPFDGWVAVTGGQVQVWETSETGAVLDPPVFSGTFDQENPINDIVGYDGYLFGGGPGGNLHVVTSRPWVYPGSMQLFRAGELLGEGEVVSSGDEVTLRFQVREEADYTVQIGGDRRRNGGVEVAEGSTPADTDVNVTLPVTTTDYSEGINHIYAIAENDLGLLGHARISLVVDNPPLPPELTDENVDFADGALNFSFEGIPDEDLDFYDIYVTATRFSGASFPTGGPDFDGDTELEAPLRVQSNGGERVTLRIEPLENDVTYYIGVRATDTGGKEGPMSSVVSGTPRKTYTAAELADDQGGAPCSTGGPGLAWWAVGAAMLAGLRRRRSLVAASWVPMVALALAVVAPMAAHAQEADRPTPPWLRKDLTPARGNFELRYGVINLDDENITNVYKDNPANLLQAEIGPQFFRVAELDFGFGFFQELAFTVAESGTQSGERTMLTWWPFYIDATARLHILDEQPLVPFVRYGWDYVLWSEKSDNSSGTKDTVRGAKFGTHTSLGLQLLLDIFQPRRASLLEAQSGINDSWVTLEWRRQRVDGRSQPWSGASSNGLTFSGDAILVGLKLDY